MSQANSSAPDDEGINAAAIVLVVVVLIVLVLIVLFLSGAFGKPTVPPAATPGPWSYLLPGGV